MKRNLQFNFLIIYFSVFAICSTNIAQAQKEHNKWYFGYNAAMDFNGGAPVLLSNSAMNQWEGCSSIADTNGNLLFYTDGLSAWNRNHVVMANGTGLQGNPSSTQSAMIVRKPGSYTIYYIFTTDGTGAYGTDYSEVDMTLNGGLGGITANKNILLVANTAEKLCGVRHANGTDVWVMTHLIASDAYYCYLVTATGVNMVPVITNIGTVLTGNLGTIKFSPDGSMLADAVEIGSKVDLFKFDNATGQLSNFILLNAPYFVYPYALSFSPNSKMLYVINDVSPNGNNAVMQYDITTWTQAAVLNSADTIGYNTASYMGTIQIAPDGKMYIARENQADLGVINYPDSVGVACSFVTTGFNLAPFTCGLGLPNYVEGSDSITVALPVAHFTSSDTAFCSESGECIDFFDHSTGNPTSWQWFFTGAFPDTSTLQNPTNICYFNPGTYEVKLIISNGVNTDTLDVSPHIIFAAPPPPPTVTVFGGDTLISSHASVYQWYYNGFPIAGATDSSYVAMQGGTYAVRITDSLGCSLSSNGVLITGFLNGNSKQEINIYPNPASNELFVSLATSIQEEVEIIFTDVVGRELRRAVLKKSSSSGVQSISVRDFSTGIYFVQIHLSSGVMNRKIMIEK